MLLGEGLHEHAIKSNEFIYFNQTQDKDIEIYGGQSPRPEQVHREPYMHKSVGWLMED